MDPLPLAISCVGALLGLSGALAQGLGRETIGEVRRRLATVESTVAQQATELAAARAEIAILKERSTTTSATLTTLADQMVPRKEWEGRTSAQDGMLHRILEILGTRRASHTDG